MTEFIPKSVRSFVLFVWPCSSYITFCLFFKRTNFFHWLPWQMPHQRFQSFDFFSICQNCLHFFTLCQTVSCFDDAEDESFWKIVGKDRNADNQHFLLFAQCFLLLKKKICLDHLFVLWSAYVFKLSLINSLPEDKILVLTELKEFADDKFNGAKMMICDCDWVENIVEKDEMLVNWIFSCSHNV